VVECTHIEVVQYLGNEQVEHIHTAQVEHIELVQEQVAQQQKYV